MLTVMCPRCGLRVHSSVSNCPRCAMSLHAAARRMGALSDATRDDAAYPVTTRDFALLMNHLRALSPGEPAKRALADKLDRCEVVLSSEMPAGVVSLNSRVVFAVDGGPPEWRVLVEPDAYRPFDLTLPITAPLGIAMLGLRAGESATATRYDGSREIVDVHEVVFQKEAFRRALGRKLREASADWPSLRAAADPWSAQPAMRQIVEANDFDDDGGPAAA